MEFSKDSYNLYVFLTFILTKKCYLTGIKLHHFLHSLFSLQPLPSSLTPLPPASLLYLAASLSFIIIVTHIQMYTCICMSIHTDIHTDTHGHRHSHIQPAESSFVSCEYMTSKLATPHYISNKVD